jgi:hypothetical protein
MTLLRKIFNVTLIVLNAFLALTAILGGLAILAGVHVPSTEELTTSIFKGATVPGIALTLIVGGSALLATILLLRKSNFALLASILAGIIIMFFEFVEVQIIGAPPGVAQNLQIFYFGLGTLIACVALGMWLIDLSSNLGSL